MAARTSKIKRVFSTAVIILLFILAVGMLASLLNKAPSFALKTHDGAYVVSDTSGLEVSSGDAFTVKTLNKDYTVSVKAAEAADDFTFTVNGATYTWNTNVAGNDLSGVFEITRNGKTFYVNFPSVGKILETLFDSAVTLPTEAALEQNLFALDVTSGKDTISVNFTAKEKSELSPDGSSGGTSSDGSSETPVIDLPEQIVF